MQISHLICKPLNHLLCISPHASRPLEHGFSQAHMAIHYVPTHFKERSFVRSFGHDIRNHVVRAYEEGPEYKE